MALWHRQEIVWILTTHAGIAAKKAQKIKKTFF
jgi:hypothetical protein